MKKITGIFFAASVLCFWFMVSFAVAAPQSSQPPSSGQAVQSFPSHWNRPTGDIEAGAPHIVGQEVHPAPPIKLGESIEIRCAALARGCVKKSFDVKIEVDGTSIFEGEIQSLDPECKMAENYPYPRLTWDNSIGTTWVAGLGNHTIRCILDSKKAITELNENNNTASRSFTVQMPASDKVKDIKTKQPIPVPVPGTR